MSDKPLYQKLHIKSGSLVRLDNLPDVYADLSSTFPEGVQVINTDDVADIILTFVEDRQGLQDRLPLMKAYLAPTGALWVAYRKGNKTDINRDSINKYARTLRLQGVAMIAIDETWASLRLKAID